MVLARSLSESQFASVKEALQLAGSPPIVDLSSASSLLEYVWSGLGSDWLSEPLECCLTSLVAALWPSDSVGGLMAIGPLVFLSNLLTLGAVHDLRRAYRRDRLPPWAKRVASLVHPAWLPCILGAAGPVSCHHCVADLRLLLSGNAPGVVAGTYALFNQQSLHIGKFMVRRT